MAGSEPQRTTSVLALTSPAFQDGETIPTRHTADGEDLSPPLGWSAPPEGTRSFAVICEDHDAPSGTFVHWLVWDIDASERRLPEGAVGLPREGRNGFGVTGYGGPSPPPGLPHRYRFRVLALDTVLGLPNGARRPAVDQAIAGHVLAEGGLTGLYGR